MNLGSIMDMIRKDQKIKDDIDGFIKRVNQKSIAEANGGDATEKEVLTAIDMLEKEPLIEAANAIHQGVLDDINSGSLTTTEAVKARYGN